MPAEAGTPAVAGTPAIAGTLALGRMEATQGISEKKGIPIINITKERNIRESTVRQQKRRLTRDASKSRGTSNSKDIRNRKEASKVVSSCVWNTSQQFQVGQQQIIQLKMSYLNKIWQNNPDFL
jgi:hypothetical protein